MNELVKDEKKIANNTLKILVVNDVFPHIKNATTILFNNIVPLIKKEVEIKVFWIITENYGKKIKLTDPNYEIFYLSDYNNAYEILDRIKPDLSYHLAGYSLIDYAFMMVERYLKIPNFGFASGGVDGLGGDYFREETSRKKLFLEHKRQFFEKKSSDYGNSTNEYRGKNFLRKCLFLIRTLRSIGKSYLYIIKEIIYCIKLFYRTPDEYNEKFNCNLIFTENKSSIDWLVKTGLKRENIRAVGNPVFHQASEKKIHTSLDNNNKLNVLFITANLTSGQGKSNFSKLRRNKMIQEIIIGLKKINKDISLVIKIHPTAENYIEFEQFVDKAKNIDISQRDDIMDLVNKADIIITPVTSTATIIAVIMDKPVIIWNYFDIEEDLLLRKNIVLECKNNTELDHCINTAESFRVKNLEKIKHFIDENFSYGDSSQLIVNEILDLLRRHSTKTN